MIATCCAAHVTERLRNNAIISSHSHFEILELFVLLKQDKQDEKQRIRQASFILHPDTSSEFKEGYMSSSVPVGWRQSNGLDWPLQVNHPTHYFDALLCFPLQEDRSVPHPIQKKENEVAYIHVSQTWTT